MKYPLRTPIHFEGEEISELDLKLEDMTGADLIAVEREMAIQAGQSIDLNPMKEFSKDYLARVAAKAAGKPAECIQALRAADFTQVTAQVQAFLFGEG